MLLLPQAPQKDSEFKGFLPSVTAILLSAACSDQNINLPLATFWHCLAESLSIDSPGFGESCKKHIVSMGNAAPTYGRRPNMPSPSAESQAGMRAVVYGYFSLGQG